jgi:hypothetical protein
VLPLLDGKTVLFGPDYDAVTFLHYVEHIADIPRKRVALSGARHREWPSGVIGLMRTGQIASSQRSWVVCSAGQRATVALAGNAMTHVLTTRELLDFALPLMKAVAAGLLSAESLKEKEWRGNSRDQLVRDSNAKEFLTANHTRSGRLRQCRRRGEWPVSPRRERTVVLLGRRKPHRDHPHR